ncbi:MAG: insulinase family protein [Alphaproteobacteria bacterium]|nr:insulinase family protein [Alphaproteobacteria bacterium]MCB9791623.1 insulinase family protein [Alphaproteobacteria bacterium]
MKPLRALALLAASAVPLVALADRPPRPDLTLRLDPYNIGMQDYTFPSGLRIIFQEDHTQPIVSITTVIDRGSSHDPAGLEGIAHLVEHLWFRSVQGEGMPKVWNVLAELGASLNASTAQDWTNYMTVAPKEALPVLLELEAKRLTNTVDGVTEEIVSTEREIVRNELRLRYENTGGSAFFYVWDKLYPQGHPYARMGIGTHDSLNAIRLTDVQSFVAKNYVPENTTIVVVGDFDVDQEVALISQAFPPELLVDPENPDAELALIDPPVRVSGEAEPPPPPANQAVSYHKGGVDKTNVLLAWSLPGGYRPEEPLMQITVWMMNQFLAAQLDPDFNPLTDDAEDASSIGCFLWSGEVNSQAMCTVEVGADDDPEEIAEDVLDGLYNMWNVNNLPIQQAIFANAIKSFQAQIFRNVEVVSSIGSGRATDTAAFTHFTGDPLYFSRQFEWLSGIEVSDATQFAQKYLNRDRVVTVVLEPYEDEDIDTTSSDAVYKGAVREEEAVSMIDLSEVNEAMLTQIMVPPDLSGAKEFTLSNGLDVVLYPYGEAPLARVHLVFDGGEWTEPVNGLTETAYRYGGSDIGSLDPLDIAGSWEISFGGSTQQSFGIVASSANLDGELFLLREYMDNFKVSPGNKRNTVKLNTKRARSRRKDPAWWSSELRYTNLFPGHEISETQDELWWAQYAEVSTADAQAWVDELIQPANGTLYIIGRVDPVQAEELVRTYFDGWTSPTTKVGAMKLPAPPPEATPGRKIYVLNDDLVSQSDVTLSCQIGPATTENYEARKMLAEVLSEEAWLALREQSGVTYGAGASQAGYPGGPAMLSMSSTVQNDSAGLAVDIFTQLSDRAVEGDLSQDRLTLMKLAEARKYAQGHQTTGQMFNRLSPPYRDGWSHIDGRAERLAAVTIADLSAQMERCNGREVITVVGPADVIAPQLDKLGVEYEVFDYEAEADRIWEERDPKGYAKAKKKETKKKAKEE